MGDGGKIFILPLVLISAIVLIDKKLEQIKHRLEHNCNVEGEYLTHLLSSTQMDIRDVYGSVAELLLAGVDTVTFFFLPTKYCDCLVYYNKECYFSRSNSSYFPKRPSCNHISHVCSW